MESLLKITETGEFEDNGLLFLKNSHWQDDDIELLFELNDGVDGNPNANWIIKAHTVHEYKIFEAYDCGLNHHKENHIIISQYTENIANLFFRGTHSCPEAVVGALFEAHVECAQDWIDFEKYINKEQKLSNLIKAGFGKLAGGPEVLLKKYQSILTKFGISSNITSVMPAKRWNGSAWVDFSSAPEMIHFGGSFIVADSFHASKLTIT
jgi:hypothetical protein